MKLHIKYPNLTFLGISIVTASILTYLGVFAAILGGLGGLGYLGALIAGIFFPITFTSPLAAVALFYLGAHYNIYTTVIFGTIGAVIGDLLIFTVIKDKTVSEIEEIRSAYKLAHRGTEEHRRRHESLLSLFHTKPFHALALFIGGILILLPGPDEFGIAIFASYKFNIKKFIPLSFIFNAIGVWMTVYAGEIFGR